jgi:hypothetical protein
MPADRSRRTDGLRDAYVGVVAQQGRVTLDRDFNAEHGYLAGRMTAQTIDLIGPSGTPDDGFRISLPAAGDPPLWTPPAPLPAPAQVQFDVRIAPGVMYLGGQRAFLWGKQDGHPIIYSYFDQPDWAHVPGVLGPDGQRPTRELVYLAAWEQEVSAVEDPDLLDVALGGPDTTQRLRLMRRVVREPVDASDCSTAWNAATALWHTRDGLVLNPATMRLRSETRLQVSFPDEGATTDPCDPIVTSGYLGADNQLIRVQIADPSNGQAQLLWGYDNASFLYRATPLASNAAMLSIAPLPPDAFHVPQTGQVVEILRTAAVLESVPDATDPTGQKSIVRCVAEPTGIVRRLTQPFGPSGSGDPTPYIVLDQPLPAEYLADTTPLFLRVWQSQIAFDRGGGTVLLTDDVTGASTGVQVTISTPAGIALTRGVYWLIAIRPSTPQAVYPERLLIAPQPPDGPPRWACPLAVLDWTKPDSPSVTDCRNTVGGLSSECCCTVTVKPGDKLSLQQAIDMAAASGGVVCLMPGTYSLPKPLLLTSKHAGITVEACGVVRLLASKGDEDAFALGLIVIAQAPRVTLRGLTLGPPSAARPGPVFDRLTTLLRDSRFGAAALAAAANAIRVMVGVHVGESPNVTIENCTLEMALAERTEPFDLFGVALLLQGNCGGLSVTGCSFDSSIVPSFNPIQTVGRPAQPTLPLDTHLEPRPTALPVFASAGAADIIATVRTGFESIVANRVDASAIVVERTLSALVGCLALPALGIDQKSVTCNLGDTVLRENIFAGFTLPFFALARVDALRILDNEVRESLGGFWLVLNDWQKPVDSKSQSLLNGPLDAAFGLAELDLIASVGITLPLPFDSTGAPGTQPPVGPASIFVNGNQIEPVAMTRKGTSCLLMLVNRTPIDNTDTTASLIVANNRLRSRSGPRAPTALIATAKQERCVISSNLILSESATGTDPGPSLWLAPEGISDGVTLLSVVGNVIDGPSDLGQFPRAGITPSQTWTPYNAMPS